MRYTRRFALGALGAAILTGCGGGGGGGDPGPGLGGGGDALGSGGGGTAPPPAPFSAFGPTVIAGNAGNLAPAAARLAGGGNVALWMQDGDIRGRFTDSGGAPVGSEFTAIPASFEGGSPLQAGAFAVAPAADGGFVLAWGRDTARPTTQFSAVRAVHAARFSATGGLLWDAQVSDGLSATTGQPVIEPWGDGFLVGWTAEPVLTAPNWAYLRRVAADGTTPGPQVQVDPATAEQEQVGVAPLADGTAIAVWRQRYFVDGSPRFQLHARRFDASLDPLTPATPLPGFPATVAFPVDAEALDDGNVAIAWGTTAENTRPLVSTAVFTPGLAQVSGIESAVLEFYPSDVRVLSFGPSGYGVAWQVERAQSREMTAGLWLWRFGMGGAPAGDPQNFEDRLTMWVSPTTGATVSTGAGFDMDGGDDGHWIAAFHRANASQPDTYLMGR